MGFVSEFKSFIMRGNVVDLAVGVIIGGAFGKIVESLVADLITPVLLKPALEKAGAASIETWAPGGVLLGKFIAAIISFIVIAFVLFLIIKGMNAAMKKKEEAPAAPPAPTKEEVLLTEIRDLLKQGR
ncbi:MAG: large conductance mechanosensitive channel protein MscL [Bacteroidia bacterium]|jgi:large conductance mechanosensitive channel|nr:large conductance mechanosensitive channel protein MscL [Bacteroidia bacterium]